MKTLIEVGAFDGCDSLRYHHNGFTVYTFEPKKDLFQDLFEKTKHLTNYTVIPKAVSLTNGTTKFNICNSGGASSILPFRPNHELIEHWTSNRWDIQFSGISYDIETIRLDTFIEENGLQDTIIDFIHIDAQGVDLNCLKSLGIYIKNVLKGVLETVINIEKSIYIGQEDNTLEKIRDFLSLNGFKVTYVESNDATNCEFNIHFEKI